VKKLIFIIIFLIVALAGIFYGAKIGDVIETQSVGSIMCLSCMGIE